MPYSVQKSGDCPASKPFACVKTGTGEVMGCHATSEAAQEQVKALYANEKKASSAENSNKSQDKTKTSTMSAKEFHDRWLQQKPEGAMHDAEGCPLCQDVEEATGGAGDSMSDKTHTAEDLAAAVAAAVKPLEDKIRDLEAKDAEAEVETKISEAKAELESKITDLQSQLDVKVAEAEAAKQELEAVKSFLEAEKAREEEEAAAEARKNERLELVKENANYSDEYIEAQAERWAKMSDEDFVGLIDNLKAAGVKKEESKKDDELPADTKLNAGGEQASKEGTKSNLGVLHELKAAGFNPARLS